MRGKKSFLRTFLALALVLFIGLMPNIQNVYTSAEDEISTTSVVNKHKSWIKELKTPLHNGDTFETIRLDLVPLIKDLATGTVPNDELTWEFKDAPIYFEYYDAVSAEQGLKSYVSYYMQPSSTNYTSLNDFLCEAIIGVYDLDELSYKTETRYVGSDIYGYTIYRCALTGISVKSWRTPYGDVCSREEALGYYNKCQERIESVVSKVISARQSNGEPLTDAQMLKWIRDWLVISVDYAHEKLNLHEIDREKYKFRHLWNEYGAIMDGETVCQGYSYAFKAIVDELVKRTGDDIECEEVTDIDHEHSWVRVKLDGEWYNIDITRTDVGFPTHYIDNLFFLNSDEWIEYDGYYSASSSAKATSNKYEMRFWETYKKDLSEYTVVVKDPKALCDYGSNISSAIEVKYGVNALPPEAYNVVKVRKMVGNMPASVMIVIPSKECNTLKGSIEVPGSVILTPCFTFLIKNRQ